MNSSYAIQYYRNLHKPRKGQAEQQGSNRNVAQVGGELQREMCLATTFFLLETSSYQPEVVALDRTTWRGKAVLVVYVNGCDGAGAYIVDDQTRLPQEYIRLTDGHTFLTKLLQQLPRVDSEKLP